MKTRQRLIRSALEQILNLNRGEWLEIKGAVLGHPDGVTIETGTPGLVYARTTNGQPIEVMTNLVPENFDMHVLIGKSVALPDVWQIIASRDPYSVPQNQDYIKYHVKQHEWKGPDRGYWDRKQVLQLTVLVVDAENFIVRVFGGTVPGPNGFLTIESQDIDLSSYQITTKAKYTTIETDDDGVLSVNDTGTEFGAPALGAAYLIPTPDDSHATVAIISIFGGQTELLDSHIYIPGQLFWGASGGGGGPTEWGDITGTLSDQEDLQAALDALEILIDDLASIVDQKATPLVMESGVTHPPVPIENSEGTDWVYSSS
jgi:hypothetical protein